MPSSAKKFRILPDSAAAAASAAAYDPDCRRCARLAGFLDEVRSAHPSYFCRPVAPFGAADASLIVVGLAPGMHGANASGRPFTGDHAGILLYETLHAFGFASQPTGVRRDDGLTLVGARITNAVKCLPPENKPVPAEIRACNHFLAADLARLAPGGAILALGRIAHNATSRALGRAASDFAFAHGACHALGDGRALFDSYHCSRYNTNTGRLTRSMFRAVFVAVARHLGRPLPLT